ncbi:MAG: hypothetical protein K8S13_03710 [Desulfobacula sp.]|uniref:hypothetical protein n=1 Tax=Desulfobacula sp. TaxID=2593537 RepID=UPI0025C0C042|nr:hypothetical protein [Desulfobacula sp.]MCD4718951.1 hypothetical protein [Desulfobacula sp.]
MMILFLISSVAFAQSFTSPYGDKDEMQKQKKEMQKQYEEKMGIEPAAIEQEVISSEVDPNGNSYVPKSTTAQEQTKVPKWNSLKSPVPSGPTDDLFCPTTPGVPIFAEDANGYSSAGTADIDAGYRIYQGYTGNFTIQEIHFWYIHAYFDGTAWGPCASGDEEPVDVEIGFFDDNLAGAGPGTQVGTFITESVTGTGTGVLFAGAYEIYEYQYVLPASVTITDGWVSLMGNPTGDPTCWFMWVNSDAVAGPNNGWQEDLGAGTGSDMGYPVSLCIYGTNNMVNNVGVSAVTSPVSGTGLTANELVTINIFNSGSADFLTGFPVEYTYLGTTYTEPYPGPLLSGGTDTYTFLQTIDASAVGVYTLTACTVLPGDVILSNGV